LQTPRDNATTRRLIDMSQSSLVLSVVTAFLALEPGMGGDTCRACRTGTGTATATKDITNDSFRLSASPNPFKETTTLKVSFPAFKVGQKAQMTVYNLMGQAVKNFNLEVKTGDTSAEVIWDSRDVPSGIYLVRFTSGTLVKTLKIVKTE
jgi:Secretion system C-terminal sorting domain